MEDAVYIEDAVRTILNNTGTELYGETVLIESGHTDMWWKCAKLFKSNFSTKESTGKSKSGENLKKD